MVRVKTLFLTQDFPPFPGGIARMYGELCRRFPAGGVEVSTIRCRDGVSPAALAPPPGAAAPGTPVVVHHMPFDFRQARLLTSVVPWAQWAARHVAAGGFGALQVGNIRPFGYLAAWVRWRQGVPYLVYVHGSDVRRELRRVQRSLRARRTAIWIFGGAAAIIANSRATAGDVRLLLEHLGVPAAEKVRVVHLGTDPRQFRPDAPGAAEWRKRLGLAGRRVLLTVARLVPRKGIDTVLQALPALAAAEPRVVYLVVGAGPDAERLEGLASELGVADRVRFLGEIEDERLPGVYAAADIFVMAARDERDRDEVEGFGIVFCEANAAALPVVAGASGGVPDAVRDGETGLLVPPQDAAALADAVRRLLLDAGLRRRLGQGGREWVERYYNWDRAAVEAWAIVEEVAGEGRVG